MTAFIGWTPPPGVAVVAPPVHGLTMVDVIYSDGSTNEGLYAENLNWSSVGDGPSIVAYAIVQEYKPAPCFPTPPRERYLCVRDNGNETMLRSHEVAEYGWIVGVNAFLMREVPAAREVVAWAVWRGEHLPLLHATSGDGAQALADNHGGTVVKLTGVMP